MKELKTEIIIDAPKDKIWSVMMDFPAYPEWSSFIRSIEGEAKPGARLKNTLSLGASDQVFKPVITRMEEGKVFEWLGSLPLGLFKGRHYFILEELGAEQTKLIHGESFSGLLRGLIMKKVGEDTLRGFQAWNKALKTRVEELK
ncbi:MAG: SRPBCC domain-containing protein [Saprospiraceae bacterium]|nr:SRPBCC domain-containing protein [Saprospiraceae bacterium]